LAPDELMNKARLGERAAQVLVAERFAKEAATLIFLPEAANAALGDAAHWYSLAETSGSPGVPSLKYAGVRRYPLVLKPSR